MVDFKDLNGGLNPVLLDIESILIVFGLEYVATWRLVSTGIGDSILVDDNTDWILVSTGLDRCVIALGKENGTGRIGVTVTLTSMSWGDLINIAIIIFIKKEPAEAGIWVSVARYVLPQAVFRLLMRKLNRLHL